MSLEIVWQMLQRSHADVGSFRITGEEIRGPCPVHGGDNLTAWSYNARLGIWRCWTHGCQDVYGSSVSGLARALNVEVPSGVKVDIVVPNVNKLDPYARRWNLQYDHPYLQQRGWDADTCRWFEIGVVEDRHNQECVAFTVYDLDGVHVGYTKRAIRYQGSGSKWRHTDGLRTGWLLYGSQFLTDLNWLILTESPWDCLYLLRHGVRNVVATFGASLTYGQRQIVERLGIKRLVVAWDRDEAGVRAAQRLRKVWFRDLVVLTPCFEPYKDADELPSWAVSYLFEEWI